MNGLRPEWTRGEAALPREGPASKFERLTKFNLEGFHQSLSAPGVGRAATFPLFSTLFGLLP